MNDRSFSHAPAALVPLSLGAFLLLTSAFDLLPQLGTYNAKRLLEVLLLPALMGTACLLRPLRNALAEQMAQIPLWVWSVLCLALSLGVVSALRHPFIFYGLVEPALLALLLACALIVAASRRVLGEAFDRLAIGIVALLGLVVATQELMGIVANWQQGLEYNYEAMLMRFTHRRFYNQLQTWSIPLLAGLPFVFGHSKKIGLLTVCLLGLQWCLLLVSGGRGSFISILFALVLAGLAAPGLRRRWGLLNSAGLVLGGLLFIAIHWGQQASTAGGGKYLEQSVQRPMFHSTGRTHLWRLAWRDFHSHPWLGTGPSRFHCDGNETYLAHPHNFPLQLLAEWGLPATLLIFLAFAWLAHRVHAQLRAPPADGVGRDTLLLPLSASVLAAALHANLSGLLIMPATQVMAMLVLGWLLGLLNPLQARLGTKTLLTCVLLGACLLCATAIATFSVLEVGSMNHRVAALTELDTPAAPRFWQHGRVCRYSP
jgi:O-antigen ligase